MLVAVIQRQAEEWESFTEVMGFKNVLTEGC